MARWQKFITVDDEEIMVDVTYLNMTADDIIDWCQYNKQTDWLKEIIEKPVKVFDKEGNPVLDEEGDQVERDITFIELKLAFVRKFVPELAPKAKPKKPSLKDRIKSL